MEAPFKSSIYVHQQKSYRKIEEGKCPSSYIRSGSKLALARLYTRGFEKNIKILGPNDANYCAGRTWIKY